MISDDNMLPLMNVGGELVSSWIEGVNHRDLSDYGFVKFDILGITALSVIAECVRQTGVVVEQIKPDDPHIIAEFARGHTDIIFQFNSWKTQEYLRDMRPTQFEDLVATNALLRPGATDVGMDIEYLKRKKNPDNTSWAYHPAIESVLGPTYGVLVYQEQLTQLASELAGLSLAEGEKLRKEIIKYGKSDIGRSGAEEIKRTTIDGFLKAGLTKDQCDKLWENFNAFARYGFTRNHSYPYSLIAYWQMYFRVNYPEIFFYSYCMCEGNKSGKDRDKNIGKAIRDARQFDVRFLPPDINLSDRSFCLEDKNVRFGLTQIPYVGNSVAEEIITKRPYSSLEDFESKVTKRKVNKRAKEMLMAEGAFGSVGA